MTIYKGTCPELKLKKADGTIHKMKITSSKDSQTFFRAIFDADMLEICESFMVVYLNKANNTVGYFKASQGGISGTVVDIKLIMKKALDCYASAMILCHNHPSGNMIPSMADKTVTRNVKNACEVFDIALLDHIILSPFDQDYYSFADMGDL